MLGIVLIILAYLNNFFNKPSYGFLVLWYHLSAIIYCAWTVLAFCAEPRRKKVGDNSVCGFPDKLQSHDDQSIILSSERLGAPALDAGGYARRCRLCQFFGKLKIVRLD